MTTEKISYKDELITAMKWLAERDDTLFIGQNMLAGGTSMYWTVNELPEDLRLELPVFEDIQMGMATGLALAGYTPVCIYPRMDFMLLAFNQIVNHLDKVEEMSDGMFKPKVLIRVAVGSTQPLMPGPQHCQDYTKELQSMCHNIDVVVLNNAETVFHEYVSAYKRDHSTILVELPDIYNQEMAAEFIKAREGTR